MATYSFSQVGLYNQCPKKYQFRYLDKVETEFWSSPDLILWTSVHWALEWLYKQINIFIKPTKEETLAKFHELWDEWIKEAWEEMIYKWEQTAEDYIRRWEHYIDEYYNKYSPFEWIKVIWTELQRMRSGDDQNSVSTLSRYLNWYFFGHWLYNPTWENE